VQELARLLQEREEPVLASVSVESVDSECWCLNSAISYAFIIRLTLEESVFILESYLKTMSYAYCRQSFFEKFRRQAPRDLKQLKTNITRAIEEVNERTLRKVARNMAKRVDKCIEMNGHHFQHLL
jgi:hypothetical protein